MWKCLSVVRMRLNTLVLEYKGLITSLRVELMIDDLSMIVFIYYNLNSINILSLFRGCHIDQLEECYEKYPWNDLYVL